MKIQTALVTGAARGLGFEFCRQLGKAGKSVILTARNEEAGIEAAGQLSNEGYDIHFRLLDVNNEDSVAELARQLESDFDALDLLINNAGVNSKSSGNEEDFLKNFKLSELDPSHVLEMIRTNAVAPTIMAKHMLPMLKKSRNPRVMNVSSWLGSISKKQNGGNYSYCASKAALNMLTRTFAYDVIRDGITAIMVNPGWVQTDMGGSRAKLTAEESVRGLLAIAEGLTAGDTGKFYNWDGSEHDF
jgi:NAD(P)-dependent dehydrogenase (short-subunit alcohol dehydrogenase family)